MENVRNGTNESFLPLPFFGRSSRLFLLRGNLPSACLSACFCCLEKRLFLSLLVLFALFVSRSLPGLLSAGKLPLPTKLCYLRNELDGIARSFFLSRPSKIGRRTDSKGRWLCSSLPLDGLSTLAVLCLLVYA